MHFTTYVHHLVLDNDLLLTRKFIILKYPTGLIQFTDFHKYVMSPHNRIHKITQDGNNRFSFICQFLNYAFFVANISKLDDLTESIVEDFLNAYGMCKLPSDNDNTKRTEKTVKLCVSTVMDFMELYINDKQTKSHLKIDDLYKWVNKRDKRGKVAKVKVPRFDVHFTGNKKTIYRDIPNNAFDIIFEHVINNHPEILGLVSLSAFCGLRPSEACNVRRIDSPLGPGILFDMVNGQIHRIYIDIRAELNLRSDMVSIGKIKKERKQEMPSIFLKAFKNAYDIYMKYLSGKKYEKEYAPFSVNKRGKALTYDRYRQIFREMIHEEIVPIFLNSNDPELVIYGRTLMEHKLSPHVFRHWYTVQLVLSGISDPANLMYFRGDTSPESALTYLQNKGELEKQYRKVNNDMFEYMLWSSQKKYD